MLVLRTTIDFFVFKKKLVKTEIENTSQMFGKAFSSLFHPAKPQR